jgi:hypothetical protein
MLGVVLVSDHVVFEDNSVKVKEAMKDEAIKFLHEVGGELRSMIQRKSRRKTSKTAGEYKYRVDEDKLAVYIGSNYVNAIWEEFGTGEHALNKDGRKGWWVYVAGSPIKESSKGGKSYTAQEAKKIVALLRSKGLDAHMTQGKTANRPMWKSYQSSKSKIIKRASQIFKGLNS